MSFEENNLPPDGDEPFEPLGRIFDDDKDDTAVHESAPDPYRTLGAPPILPDKVCYSCGKNLYSLNDNFCAHCGMPQGSDHDLCGKCETTLVPNAKFCHECGARVDKPPILCIFLDEGEQEIRVPRNLDVFVVGRTVPEQNIEADLDLTNYGDRRISRQHARFVLTNKRWYLEDMNSKSGTRVDNETLQPFTPVEIIGQADVHFADVKVSVVLDFG